MAEQASLKSLIRVRIPYGAPLSSITDAEFISAVTSSVSVAEILIKLGRSLTGSNYIFVKRNVARLNLNTSHLLGKKHGKTGASQKISWDKILIENSPYHLFPARKQRLISENLIPYKCAICACLPIWQSKSLVLRLDHINGKNRDHRLSNLRFICPNCDSQLPTYCGKNKTFQSQKFMTDNSST